MLDAGQVRRYGRQIALGAVGIEGQERVCAATVAVVGAGLAAETAARYLEGAGARVRRVAQPLDWVAALRGAAVVVRSNLDDDPMLRAAVRLGTPVVAMRAQSDAVDVIALRRHGPCPHAALDIPARPAEPGDEGAAGVLAGTLAAAEALWLLVAPGEPPRARHLRLSLGEGEPATREIPWAPECFLCGGRSVEAVLR